MQRIVIVGGGFAGFWSAAGAARKLDQLGVEPDTVEIVLVEKNDYHNIRVRNYEPNPGYIIPLGKILGPVGVVHLRGEAVDIDTRRHIVKAQTASGLRELSYDRLVHAAGSQVFRPDIPGLAEHAFEVDTHTGAKHLERHLMALPESSGEHRYTVLVVGAGLTGIETACELPTRLAKIRGAHGDDAPVRVILADASPVIGSDMGEPARAVIAEALADLELETRTDVRIATVDEHGVTLADGETIAAETVVWCTGMRANPLGASLPVEHDASGRVEVDDCLRVRGLSDVFAAGDTAWFEISNGHKNIMSCQHGRPMGRYAGHNVVADLLGAPLLPLRIDWYTTILDLGPWGAVYTEGWDRQVVATGATAKQTKRAINRHRIYPPLTGQRADILAAAAPQVQTPPDVSRAEQ